MKGICAITIMLSFFTCCQGQQSEEKSVNNTKIHVGGRCEGCEAIYESSHESLSPVDTLPGFDTSDSRLKLSGVIYEADGVTPAGDVVLYIYHTDEKGIYPKLGNETGWAKRHGYLRGWVKTDADGRYTFYTSKPAGYPESQAPAHVHATIKEPEFNEYYIADYLFADDPRLRHVAGDVSLRGGSGVIQLKKENDLWVGYRDIILGKNIPDHPATGRVK